MCKDCVARARMAREALFSAKIGEALGHAAKGAAEIIGVKEKTGVSEQSARKGKTTPAAPGNDADSAQE